jgi:hypothetical protein
VPHYQRDCPIEKERVARSSGPTTVGDLGKAERIHAAVNNCQVEHQSTILEMLGMITDNHFSILIDLGATEFFISSVVVKIIKVKEFKRDEFRHVE